MDVRALPGTRIANPTTREIVYAPPEGADVIRDKLSDWELSLGNAAPFAGVRVRGSRSG